jgi:HK97 gp10 family phage protein
MATKTRQTVTGFRELGETLRGLKSDVQERIARRTTNAGAQVVKEAVIQKAGKQPTLADKPFVHNGVTYQPGHIARNVIVKRLTPEEADATSAHIVAVRSNKGNGYAGRIASLNEFGTVKMAAQPFMRPGFDASKGDALTAMTKVLSTAIPAAVKKQAKVKK